jgi:hypothetical protein
MYRNPVIDEFFSDHQRTKMLMGQSFEEFLSKYLIVPTAGLDERSRR